MNPQFLGSKTDTNIQISIITHTITNDENNKIIYHLDASLKDLGNKWFVFSKLEDDNLELLEGRI